MENEFSDNVSIIEEEKLISFIDKSIYGYVEYNIEGNIKFANKSAIALSGYKIEGDANFKNLIIKELIKGEKCLEVLILIKRESNTYNIILTCKKNTEKIKKRKNQ